MTDYPRERSSQPVFGVAAQHDIRIPMRDRVGLAADLYSPDAPGPYPALVSMSPYGKDIQKLPVPPFPTDGKLGNGGIEAGNSEYFARRGYAHLIVDCRGTASSEGAYTFFGPQEYQDGYDVIEWAARQPWCDGNVGMLGTSYFSMVQYGIAAEQPPHLKAIFAIDAATDLYRHWAYHGGILNTGFMSHWWAIALVHTIVSPLAGTELSERVRLLKEDADIRAYPTAYIALADPGKNPHLLHMLLHPTDGPYYWERSGGTRLGRILVPTYVLGRWTSWGLHLPGAFAAFSGIKATKRLEVIIPQSGAGFTRPWDKECHETVLRWYDHWLKGIDTGMMSEPPVKLYVQGTGRYRYSDDWPIPETKWTELYLRSGGRLLPAPASSQEEPDVFVNEPDLQRGERVPSLTNTTDPVEADLEITGPIALHLFASLDASDANWIIELQEVGPDDRTHLISLGWLKASHRKLDEAESRPWRPVHPHTSPAPVTPGEVVRYVIELRETSILVPRGHRLRLLVKGQDAPWEGEGLHTHLPNPRRVRHSIHHSPTYRSHILLPVIPS